jgi:hypothetical protein
VEEGTIPMLWKALNPHRCIPRPVGRGTDEFLGAAKTTANYFPEALRQFRNVVRRKLAVHRGKHPADPLGGRRFFQEGVTILTTFNCRIPESETRTLKELPLGKTASTILAILELGNDGAGFFLRIAIMERFPGGIHKAGSVRCKVSALGCPQMLPSDSGGSAPTVHTALSRVPRPLAAGEKSA